MYNLSMEEKNVKEKIYHIKTKAIFALSFAFLQSALLSLTILSANAILNIHEESARFSPLYDDHLKKAESDLASEYYVQSNYSSVDGRLKDSQLDAYLASEHDDWNFSWENLTDNFTFFNQLAYSQYRLRYTSLYDPLLKSYWYSEGNCVLVAIYSYLYNLPTVKSPNGVCREYYSGLLDGRVTHDLSAYFEEGYDVLYGSMTSFRATYTSEDNVKALFWIDGKTVELPAGGKTYTVATSYDPDFPSIANIEDLYWKIRSESILRGYHPETGLNFGKYGKEVVETVANYYGEEIETFYSIDPEEVVRNIIEGIPVIVSVLGSKVYHNHAMVITGYRRYFDSADNNAVKYLWQVADGGSDELVWFDPSKSDSVNYLITERIEWPTC